jgi:hypothetical protein
MDNNRMIIVLWSLVNKAGHNSFVDIDDEAEEALRQAIDILDINKNVIPYRADSIYFGKWIDVNDMLPQENTQVLVCCDNGDIWLDDYFCYGFDDCKDSVVAWMPLPEPYKWKEDDNGE